MSDPRFKRLQQLFHAAVELPAGQQQAWLKQQCGDDASLHCDVLSLLAADRSEDDPLERGLGPSAQRHLDDQRRAVADVPATEDWTGQGAADTSDLLANLSGYEVHEEIGRGGFGRVMRATRQSDGTTVALKFMLPALAVSEQRRRMFLREIDVAQTLKHRNILPLFESGPFGTGFYFVMPLCEAGSLEQRLQRRSGRISLRAAVGVLRQCLAGLAHAHQRGIVHRDLKPSNILLQRRGEKSIPQLCDFGLAKSFQQAGFSGLTATGQFAGTARYMPREQMTDFRYLRPASDVWSMAAVFYHMVTGQTPRTFVAGEDPVQAVLNRPAAPICDHHSEIPVPLAAVIDRALDDDADQRYADAGAFRRAVEKAISS